MRYSFDRPRKIRTIICVGIVFEISLALWIWNADFFEGIRIYLLPFVILHAAIGVYELTVNNYYEFHDGCLIMKYSQFRKKRSIHLAVFLDGGVRAGASFFAGARNWPVRVSRAIRTSFPGCFTMTFGCFLTSGIGWSLSGVVGAREVDLARPFLVEERKV